MCHFLLTLWPFDPIARSKMQMLGFYIPCALMKRAVSLFLVREQQIRCPAHLDLSMLERRNLIEMLGSRFTTLFKKYWLCHNGVSSFSVEELSKFLTNMDNLAPNLIDL
ncbi:hypothetical protein Patl1_32412 [Pistacia atlantica]|uniref:Uncharacterized protein n=1 Tax=Pistacia atlantica TaxID=434234 RepID=A0ACC1AP52_9ROSI|nr:hypothetical protein Patl1_32412 [Pistacia atlantica]